MDIHRTLLNHRLNTALNCLTTQNVLTQGSRRHCGCHLRLLLPRRLNSLRLPSPHEPRFYVKSPSSVRIPDKEFRTFAILVRR